MTTESARLSALPLTAARAQMWTRAAFLLLGLSFLFRLVYGAATSLANDETYYWQWSRHPALSYFDQGPGAAWCVGFGTAIFGINSLGVRFASVLLGTATAYLVYQTARRWLGDAAAFWSVVLLAVAPLLCIGGIVATYDGPQVFCWAAALYGLTRAVQDNKSGWWYVVGAFVGLGFLCKLTMSFFAPSVLLFLLVSPTYRRHLATPHPYLAFGLAVLVASPVLIWSMQNGWTSVWHAQALASRSNGASPGRWVGDFLGSQALVVSPFIFFAEVWALGRMVASLKGKARDESHETDAARFVLCFTGVVLLVCLNTALRSKLEANWAAPMHVAGLMAAGSWFALLWERSRGGRVAIGASIAFSMVLTGIILFPQILPALGIRVSASLAQKANETYGWPEVMVPLQAARKQLEAEGKPVFLASTNYRVPSLLAYHLPDHPETYELFLSARHDQYWFWTKPETLVGQNALLCLDDPKPQALAQARLYFDSVEELAPIDVYRPGFDGPVKSWRLYACRNFKGYNPNAHVEGY